MSELQVANQLFDMDNLRPPPPPYDDLPPNPPISYWYRNCPSDWEMRDWNIAIDYRSPVSEDVDGQPLWEARLELTAKVVPLMMKEGIYWDISNVVREDGYFLIGEENVREDTKHTTPWHSARVYGLMDGCEDERWVGRLIVFSDNITLLSNFSPQGTITIDDTYKAVARNWEGAYVYQWVADQPDKFFNAIYDKTPLQGMWPGPKENTTAIRNLMQGARDFLRGC